MDFNLIENPWIPVLLRNGTSELCSLRTVFERAESVADLVMEPHERIAVMRLLICIAQRAIDGPQTLEDREDCAGTLIPQALRYLEEWKAAFNLYAPPDKPAFLQFADLRASAEIDAAKLGMSNAAGNNTTLFDNAGGMRQQKPSAARLALDLLTYQNFAPGGTIGVAVWKGVQTAPKAPDSCSGGPCIASSALHLFLQGSSLAETLSYNLIPAACLPKSLPMGVPVWERMPQSMADEPACRNAVKTYLGRLVPVSRSIRLNPETGGCVMARGLNYSPYEGDSLVYFEQTMTLSRDDKGGLHIVGADTERDIWRSLPAMLYKFSRHDIQPQVFDNAMLGRQYTLWLGALVCDKAKILGSVADAFSLIGCKALSEETIREMERLLKMAESGAFRVGMALERYLSETNIEKTKFSDCRSRLAHAYWNALLPMKGSYVRLATESVSAPDDEAAAACLMPWTEAIVCAAHKALMAMTSQNTAKEMRAWVHAMQQLPSSQSLMKIHL